VLDKIPTAPGTVEVATDLSDLAPFNMNRGGPYAHMEHVWLPALCPDLVVLREVCLEIVHSPHQD
jgi:hypothetical protein